MADRHYNIPGGFGRSDEGDNMSTTQNSRHSVSRHSSNTPTPLRWHTPVPAASAEARPESANSNQSIESFRSFPAESQQNAATPHQLTEYHASPMQAQQLEGQQEAGHHALLHSASWQQTVGYSPVHGQQSAQYSGVHGQQSAQYSPAHGQQSSAGYNPWSGYDPAQAQQSTMYNAHGQQSVQYSPALGQQSAEYGTAHGQQNVQYNGTAHGQQGVQYNGTAHGQQSAYSPGLGQQSTHYSPALGYGTAHGQQSAQYSPALGYGTAQGQQSTHYGPALGQQSPQYGTAHGQQGAHYSPAHGQQNLNPWNGYDPEQAQQNAQAQQSAQEQQNGQAQQGGGYTDDGWAQQSAVYSAQQGGWAYNPVQTQQAQQSNFQSSPTANESPPRIDLRDPPLSRKRRVEVEENGKRRIVVDSEPGDVRELRKDLEYERDMRAHAKGKVREVQRQRQTLQEELIASRRALHDMAQTTNGQTAMYDALRVSHEQAMEDLRRENLATLKAQQEQASASYMEISRPLTILGAAARRAQTEVRFAAVAARQVRPGSRPAPYHTSEAENARRNQRLKEARHELEKHPGVFIIPRPTPDDDESGDESLDEAGKQQAALAWAWQQIEKEKKRQEQSESEDEGRKGDVIQRARKSQQEELRKSEDKAYKSMARSVFGEATGLWTAKDYIDYKPASEAQMKETKNGESVPPEKSWRFFFGKSFAKCLYNRILIDRLVDKTLANVAHEGNLPEVTKDYVRALHLNVLKGAQFQWKVHQQRDDETEEEAKARAEEWEEERRVQTNSNSRKTRKRKMRMATAKRMMQIRLQEGKPEAAEIFENAGDVTRALRNEGMSSEEERVTQIVTKSGHRKTTTVLAVKVVGWREVIADKQMKMLDWYQRHQKKKRGCPGYNRVRVNEVSESPAPLRLPRNLFDPRWLQNQKKFDEDIERTLKIRKPTFKILDFDFNGADSEDAYEAEDEEGNGCDADAGGDSNNADAIGENDGEMQTGSSLEDL
ncbi:hypothetical protein GGX14DRAFT_392553 [Mycena pura]|uniref:Uncharacterized protein n=1 Tax=Mycena pura TaxID=153505 RepID=A0AAD6YD31_9AGAR|nr:hypothetical protein GGX14DRAFT_392553 [Mycena pura]